MAHKDYNEVKSSIPITEVARALGFTVVQMGSTYSIKEHASVRIYPDTNTYCRFSNGKGGSNIDFVMEFQDYSFRQSIEFLKTSFSLGMLPLAAKQATNQTPPLKKEFVLPEKSPDFRRAFAYLSKTRCLDAQIISELMHGQRIYEDDHHNAVFCGADKDGAICFATKRSTITESNYRGDVAGSSQNIGFYVDNKSSEIFVTEAPIDAISYMTLLKGHNLDYKQFNYLALCGASKNSLMYWLENKTEIETVILGLDNDDAGQIALKNHIEKIKDFCNNNNRKINIKKCTAHEKDFNDDLKKFKEQQTKSRISAKRDIEFER